MSRAIGASETTLRPVHGCVDLAALARQPSASRTHKRKKLCCVRRGKLRWHFGLKTIKYVARAIEFAGKVGRRSDAQPTIGGQ